MALVNCKKKKKNGQTIAPRRKKESAATEGIAHTHQSTAAYSLEDKQLLSREQNSQISRPCKPRTARATTRHLTLCARPWPLSHLVPRLALLEQNVRGLSGGKHHLENRGLGPSPWLRIP